MRVSQGDVVAALRRVGTAIPDRYYLGTARHESGYDTRCTTPEPNGTTSLGLFQVNVSEARESGVDGDLYDLDVNTRVFVYLAERNRAALRAALQLAPQVPDPPDMGAYLTIAHNQGVAAAVETVQQFGLDWRAYVARNGKTVRPGFNGPAICRYGTDCLYELDVGAELGALGGELGALIGGAELGAADALDSGDGGQAADLLPLVALGLALLGFAA